MPDSSKPVGEDLNNIPDLGGDEDKSMSANAEESHRADCQ